jgi:hypothetical protein
MSTVDTQEFDRVKSLLSLSPPKRDVFERLVAAIGARGDVAIAVSGSLSSGEVDDYSDLDLELVVGKNQIAEVTEWMVPLVSAHGRLLARFPATHLGLPDLWIFFLEWQDTVVKVDVWVLTAADLARFVSGARVIVAGEVRAANGGGETGESTAKQPDFADLQNKFCGWMWFTCIKIARAELAEATESLEVMRSRALLPCLHYVHSTPYEGYRKLEKRLPAQLVKRLYSTYPKELSPGGVLHALRELTRLFEDTQAEMVGAVESGLRSANLTRMTALVDSWARGFMRCG